MENFDGSANSPADNPADAGGGNEVTKFSMDDFRTKQWRESISDETLKTHGSLANIKDMDGLVKSFIHAQSMVGRDKVVIPSSDDTEAWNALYNKLGRPSTADAYELKLPEGSPEQWKGDGFKEYQKNFQQQMFDNGLTAKQAQAVWNHVQGVALEGINKTKSTTNKLVADQVEELKKEYGATIESAMSKRDAIINKFVGKEGVDFIRNDPKLNTSPTLMKLFSEMAKSFSEDTIIDNTLNPSGQMTPSEAKSKVNAMLADKNGAYHNPRHPGHDDAVDEFRRLLKMSKGVA